MAVNRRRTILGIRALGIVLIGLGLPEFASLAVRALGTDSAGAIGRANPDAVLGIASMLLGALFEAADVGLVQAIAAVCLGVALLSLSARRAHRLISRLEKP